MPHIWPNGKPSIPHVTSEWNPRRKNPVSGIILPHQGIDLVGFKFNEASEAGKVTFARYNGGAGNEIRIRHDDGTETRYKHNQKFLVKVGQRVTRGQRLGLMGTTGNSTGVHCHFETRARPSAPAQNPRTFVARRGATTAGIGMAGIKKTERDEPTVTYHAILRDTKKKHWYITDEEFKELVNPNDVTQLAHAYGLKVVNTDIDQFHEARKRWDEFQAARAKRLTGVLVAVLDDRLAGLLASK